MQTHSYKDLVVWQKSIDLVISLYALTDEFPHDERFGITSQMRRAAVSIPSNIAEGKLRGYVPECRRFFLIAFGSGGELETQITICKRLPKTKPLDYTTTEILLEEVMKMLNKMISNLSPSA